MASIYERCLDILDEYELILNLGYKNLDVGDFGDVFEEKLNKIHNLKSELKELIEKTAVQ